MLDGTVLANVSARLKDFSEVRKNTGGIFATLRNSRPSFIQPPIEESIPPIDAERKKAAEMLKSKSGCSECPEEDFSYAQTQSMKKKVVGV